MNKEKWGITSKTIANMVVVLFGVLLYLALSNFVAIKSSLGNVLSIISPFIIGIGIAYLLNMPVRFFENKVFKKLSFRRPLSIVVVYLLGLFSIVLLLSLVLPQVISSVGSLLGTLPTYLNDINGIPAWLTKNFGLSPESAESLVEPYQDMANSVLTYAKTLFPSLLNTTIQIGSSVVGVFTALIASIYMLGSKDKLVIQLRRVLYAVFPKKGADELVRIGRLSNNVFSGFISGKLLDSLIIGIMCFVFMWTTDTFFHPMPFAPLISIVIGIFNIIPFFGPFIGAVPSVIILLLVNPWSAVIFTIFIILLQQFDGNVLGPKILGDSTGLPALWVLIAIIVGGGFFGFIGMILGVPTVAVIYTLSSDFIEKRLRKKEIDASVYALQEPLAKKSKKTNEKKAAAPADPGLNK